MQQIHEVASDIVEEIVRWRMGAAYDAPILHWRDPNLNFDTSIALDFAAAGAISTNQQGLFLCPPPGRSNYNPARHSRLIQAAEDMYAVAGFNRNVLSAFLVMNDARLFPSLEFIGARTEAICLQVSYARTVESHWRSGTEVGLWPLPSQQRNWRLPTFVPTQWDKRRPELLWRGQASGISYLLEEDCRPILVGIRQMRRWLDFWLREEAAKDAECFEIWASSYQRLVAVDMCRDIPDTDVRFIPMWDGDRRAVEVAEKYLGSDVSADRLDIVEYLALQRQHKYVLSLPGNDVPSSLRHDLLSGCLVLMPKPFWESVWFFGLKPNVHYIELRADLADLEERLQWCRDNDGLCREIAAAGRAFALQYFEPSLELQVQSRMVDRLSRQTLPVGGS